MRSFAKFFMGVTIVEKPVHHHHVKSIFTWSSIVRQLMVTHNKLLIANLHFMSCQYTVSCTCKLPLCKILELAAYAECWFEFLTICKAAWYVISVVSACLSVCMYVCTYICMSNNNLKLESLHLGSLHIFSTEYGSSSYMKVQG